ncbi:MAG TPA: hypothetical protein PKY81_00810 [bacterium]|nr:hypothetical protein [bacterium]HPN29473.1 hypothetical protein [bacterium]
MDNFLKCCSYLNEKFNAEKYISVIQNNAAIPESLFDSEKWLNINVDEKPFSKKKLESIVFPDLNNEDMIVIPINNNEADGYDSIVNFYLKFNSNMYFWTLDNELHPVSCFEKFYFKHYWAFKTLCFIIFFFYLPVIAPLFLIKFFTDKRCS